MNKLGITVFLPLALCAMPALGQVRQTMLEAGRLPMRRRCHRRLRCRRLRLWLEHRSFHHPRKGNARTSWLVLQRYPFFAKEPTTTL